MKKYAVFLLLFSFSLLYAKTTLEEIDGSTKVYAEDVAEIMKEYTTKNGKKVRKVLFIDTRKKQDLIDGGTIPGSVHLNIKKSDEFNLLNILNHERFVSDVLVFCNGHSCFRAQNATLKLLEWKKSGEDNGSLGTIYYYRDGFPSYRDYRYDDGSLNPVVMPY